MKIVEVMLAAVISFFVLFAAWLVFVWLPVRLYTEAQCLHNGYPEARVSVGLERYCITLDGTTSIRVDKAKR